MHYSKSFLIILSTLPAFSQVGDPNPTPTAPLFNITDNPAIWGTAFQGTSASDYTGPFTSYTTTGGTARNGVRINEGIDGVGNLFATRNSFGATTWVSDGIQGGGNEDINFSLANVGDTAQFRFTNFFIANEDLEPSFSEYSLDFSLFEFGVIAGGAEATLGGADSFFLAGVPTSINETSNQTDVTGNFDFVAHTEESINSLGAGGTGIIDGNDVDVDTHLLGTPLATLESGLTLDSVGISGDLSGSSHGSGVAYQYDVVFENVGNGQFEITYALNELIVQDLIDNGTTTSQTGVFTNVGNPTLIDHGLDAASLADLNFAVGYRVLDRGTPVSGTTFDSFSIPEPSSALLASLSGLFLLGRRKRK